MQKFVKFHCLAERLSNFDISVTNWDPQDMAPSPSLLKDDVCATENGRLGAGETKVIPCVKVGRYVIVQLKGRNYLTMCELEVYGSKYVPD
jgi:hypothetical protein